MNRHARRHAPCLLDALGTLVELEPPWAHLAEALGVEPDERLARALRAEMAYYREHSHEGRDADSLADLRAPLRRGRSRASSAARSRSRR